MNCKRTHGSRKRIAAGGFTLIEMMITVAIIGILASVAMPQYSQYIQKSRRMDAQVVLSEVVLKEQHFLLAQRAYTTSLTSLGVVVPASVDDYYTVAVTVDSSVSPPTFSVTATAKNSQASDKCGNLTITDRGLKSAKLSGVAVAGCW